MGNDESYETWEDYFSKINSTLTWEEIFKKINLHEGFYRRYESGDLLMRCIFHQEISPSLRFSERKGIYRCFGCGTGGTYFDFISRILGSSGRAIKFFAKHFKIFLPENIFKKRGRSRNPYSFLSEDSEKEEFFELEDFFEQWPEIKDVLDEIYIYDEPY